MLDLDLVIMNKIKAIIKRDNLPNIIKNLEDNHFDIVCLFLYFLDIKIIDIDILLKSHLNSDKTYDYSILNDVEYFNLFRAKLNYMGIYINDNEVIGIDELDNSLIKSLYKKILMINKEGVIDRVEFESTFDLLIISLSYIQNKLIIKGNIFEDIII